MTRNVHIWTVALPRSLATLLAGTTGFALAATEATARAAEAEGATAQETAPAPSAPRWITTARVQLPFSRLVVWRPSVDASLSLLGLSLSERFADLVEGEVGAEYGANPCEKGWQLNGRGGVSPNLLRPKQGGTSWNVRVPVLAGYSYLSMGGDGCDGHSEATVHLLTVNTGIDATYWTEGRWGFNLRLLGGAGRAWETNNHSLPSSAPSTGAAFEAGLSTGVTF